MTKKAWKATFIVLGIAAFFISWGFLNLWTGRALYWGDDSRYAGDRVGTQIVERQSHPRQFWLVVSFKLTAGTLLLIILGNVHLKRWRRNAEQRKLGEGS